MPVSSTNTNIGMRSWDWLTEAAAVSVPYGVPIPNALLSIWLSQGPAFHTQFPIHQEGGAATFLGWWLQYGATTYPSSVSEVLKPIAEKLCEPVSDLPQDAPLPITRLMALVHVAREELREMFDLRTAEGRRRYVGWWVAYGIGNLPREMAEIAKEAIWTTIDDLPSPAMPTSITPPMAAIYAGREDLQKIFDLQTIQGRVSFVEWWEAYGKPEYTWLCEPRVRGVERGHSPAKSLKPPVQATSCASVGAATDLLGSEFRRGGANLIGIAFGELGIGEDVRMAARSSSAISMPFILYNFPRRIENRSRDLSAAAFVCERLLYATNIFCLTGFETLRAFNELGRLPFDCRYNIGYWPWELPLWPSDAQIAFSLIDEVWASSRYAAEAYRRATSKPVLLMPMAVAVDSVAEVDRKGLNLPLDKYLFLFVFDANSHLSRKNPIGCIKAFQKAFSRDNRSVGLIVKAMNVDRPTPEWQECLDLIRHDDRVTVISETLDRPRVLGLMKACDAFVSLHRAEGFGRGLAEALLLGRPVIATNFSGNVDFTTEKTAFMVDGPLVPLAAGDYPFYEGQSWCDPDLDIAAGQMVRCFENREEAIRRAAAGKAVIEERHSPRCVGERYRSRLAELKLI